MTEDTFTRRIEAINQRIEALELQAALSLEGRPPLMHEALEALSAALQELRVYGEDLRRHNEDLSAARNAVEAETRRYQELFEFAPDGYLVTDLEGLVREVNRAAAKLLGIRQGFTLGTPLVSLVAVESREAFQAQLARLPESEHVRDWEVRFEPRGREVFPAAINASVVLDGDGRPTDIRWMVRDISDRVRIRAEVRDLARYPSENPYPVLRIAADGVILYANAVGSTLANLWGSDVGEPAPRPLHEWTVAAIESGASRTEDIGIGDVILSFEVLPVPDAGYCNLYGKDITDRKRSEEALLASEERFRQFFKYQPDYCYMVSPKGLIQDVNDAALSALGYEREELVGKPLSTIYAPEFHDTMKRLFTEWTDSGMLRDEEAVVVTKSGQRRIVLLSATTVTDADGRAASSVSVQRDITERTRLEEQLRRAQKMESIGRVTGGLAHHFNNLLAAINGFADLIRLDMDPSDRMQQYVSRIRGAGERAADLVQQLLAYSRTQMLRAARLDLNMLIGALDIGLRDALGERIDLVTDLDPGLRLVEADARELQQAIQNLVENARDAMPDGGQVTIATRNTWLDAESSRAIPDSRPGAFVCLSVSDTGIGISEDVLERLFEPFFTTKDIGEGTGLGLAVAYGIIAQHEGWINVDSTPGAGTSFKVYLPAIANESIDSGDGSLEEQ